MRLGTVGNPRLRAGKDGRIGIGMQSADIAAYFGTLSQRRSGLVRFSSPVRLGTVGNPRLRAAFKNLKVILGFAHLGKDGRIGVGMQRADIAAYFGANVAT
jgi:hypothetical protein